LIYELPKNRDLFSHEINILPVIFEICNQLTGKIKYKGFVFFGLNHNKTKNLENTPIFAIYFLYTLAKNK
jgi:hypothetical protein